ncbi:MAG: deoxynucleoside kinase [Gammaproteobacteria bacterium]|nr:deoxynucleoside kinase [Gammaproteobacteria bacterium]
MSEKQPGYIAIEGPIGVGKTSLARRLAKTFQSDLLLEGAAENPFLERFYSDPKSAALPTQLFFLFQRAQQMQDILQGDMFSPVRIADFLIEKDRLFAELTLSADELELYGKVYESLSIDAPVPDLVIYLQAPVDTLMERIASRGIVFEQAMSAGYLHRLTETYTRFFHSYSSSALLIVNADTIDWVHNDEDYELLVKKITDISHGRHFFNPGATTF